MIIFFRRCLVVIFSVSVCACAATESSHQAPAPSRPPYDDVNVPGWFLMSSRERMEYQMAMKNMSSYEECVSYVDAHYDAMRERAWEQGLSRPMNRSAICERMRADGRFNQG